MLEALVSATLRTLLLALLVELGLRVLRVRHPQLLLAAWTAVLMASLAMPFLQSYALITVPIAVDLPVSFADLPGSETPAMDAASGATAAVAVSVNGGPAWRLWLLGGYLIVAGALLVRLLVGVVLSWNLVRAARPIRDAWAQDTWAQGPWAACGSVRASAAISAPVTVGGSIVLPLDCVGWAASTQRAVLAHERAHVAGGDFYLLLLSQLNRVLFWFNPLSWWLHCRLAGLVELTSDDAAIDALDDGPGYAAILLDMARRST